VLYESTKKIGENTGLYELLDEIVNTIGISITFEFNNCTLVELNYIYYENKPLISVQEITMNNTDDIIWNSDLYSKGNIFINNGSTIMLVKNDGVDDVVLKITSLTACNYGTVHSISKTIINDGKILCFGLFNQNRFNDEYNKISIEYEDEYFDGLSIALIYAY